jgi:hypothetical protein
MTKTMNEQMEDKRPSIVKPKRCVLKISKLGFDTFNGSYKMVETDNPVKLGLINVSMLADTFLKNNKAQYVYLLAVAMLRGINYKKEELKKDLETFNIEDFRIKENLK